MSALALRARWCGLLALAAISCATPQDVVESDCHMEAAPAPDEAGGWGPAWGTDEHGAMRPEVIVYPLSGAELWMDVRVQTADGRKIGWTEDLPPADEPFVVPITLPPEIGPGDARIRVLITATHPQTGHAIGRQAVRGQLRRQADLVQLLDHPAMNEVALPTEPSP